MGYRPSRDVKLATEKKYGAVRMANAAEAADTNNDQVAVSPKRMQAVLAGEGKLQYADVTLTSTQVKALATTQITLVAAPGAGSVLHFQGALLKLDYGGTNAFAESADNMAIKYTDDSGVAVSDTIECTGFIDATADTYTTAVPVKDTIVAATGAENQALVLDNINDNFTGNAADDNTLVVRTFYTVNSI